MNNKKFHIFPQIISRCFDFGYTIGITDFSLANNLAAIVNCMQIPDATKETPDFNNLQALMNQDVGDYYRHSFLKKSSKLTLGWKMFGLGQKCRHFWLNQNFDPFLLTNKLWLIFMGKMQNKFFFFLKKKIQNGGLKKSAFFRIANSQKFFVKISWNGP